LKKAVLVRIQKKGGEGGREGRRRREGGKIAENTALVFTRMKGGREGGEGGREGRREEGRHVPGDFEGMDVVSGVVVSHTRGTAVHVGAA